MLPTQTYPKLSAKAQEWLSAARPSLKKMRMGATFPSLIFAELRKLGYVEGSAANATITTKGYQAIMHYGGVEDQKKKARH